MTFNGVASFSAWCWRWMVAAQLSIAEGTKIPRRRPRFSCPSTKTTISLLCVYCMNVHSRFETLPEVLVKVAYEVTQSTGPDVQKSKKTTVATSSPPRRMTTSVFLLAKVELAPLQTEKAGRLTTPPLHSALPQCRSVAFVHAGFYVLGSGSTWTD